ncbi:MAG: diaminopropionate ammonia-lyase [Candidatus Krumholzibacteria bacterium]|nr:diaminopropionate ammonia-lyase [Candidatus Krumholzibacteria bacterium]
MSNFYINPNVLKTLEVDCPGKEPKNFHERLPEYRPTPLISSEKAADKLGVSRVWVKDESSRLGLPAFKILGASWAVYRVLEERFDIRSDAWESIDQLKEIFDEAGPMTLVAATDGNHGRAVARVASWFGLHARIFVPKGTVRARIGAIESEGALVTVVDGDYDKAVAAAAKEEGPLSLLIQDTGWPGYETIPAQVIDGYSTMFWEIDEQLRAIGESTPDLVVVQIGVGSLASAAVRFYRCMDGRKAPAILGVEPEGAACAFESARADRMVTVPGPHTSVMAGLNCQTLSSVAWPTLRQGIDAFVVVGNSRAFEAMRLLAEDGIVSGESGSAGMAGLLETIESDEGKMFQERFGLGSSDRILVISTEGATDPDMYKRAVGG